MATGRSGDRSRTRSRGVWYVCTSRSPQRIVEPNPALAALLRTSGPPEPCEIGAYDPHVKTSIRSSLYAPRRARPDAGARAMKPGRGAAKAGPPAHSGEAKPFMSEAAVLS